MKEPLAVSPSKGNQGTTRGKEKFLLTSVGIEPTTTAVASNRPTEALASVISFTFVVYSHYKHS